ncbi:MAG: HAD hydrolase-like protein [Chloroflexota bacterium]
MTKRKVIILDFDNVILESENVKTDAFAKLFADYPQHLEQILRHHLDNVGVPRADKFKYIYKNILKKPLSEKQFQKLCSDFTSLVLDRVIASPFVPGAKEFLERYHNIYDLYVVSATPQGEIEAIIKARNLGVYFKGVFGNPPGKDEHARRIIAENGYDPKVVVSIGDGLSEYEAARGIGCDFIARVPRDFPNRFKGLPGVRAVVRNLVNIEAYF